MTETWLSKSPAQTRRIARTFAKKLLPGDIIGLVGPLGAGKTLFTKGLCEGLGIDPSEVLSPTFTLLHCYQGRLPVYHFDTYRLKNTREFEALGYEEQFYGNGISLVEWADKVITRMPPHSRIVEFQIVNKNQRKISCAVKGEQ